MSEESPTTGSTRYWLAGIAVMFGVLIGLSAFTFVYAEGFSTSPMIQMHARTAM